MKERQVITISSAYRFEEQRINITGFSSGNFTVYLTGTHITPLSLPYNTDESTFINALRNAIPYCSSITVARSALPGGFSWAILFPCAQEQPYPELMPQNHNMGEDSDASTTAYIGNDVFPSSDPINGTFTLTLNDTTTDPLPFDIDADTLASVLEDMPLVSSVSIAQSGNPLSGQTFVVTFLAPAMDLPQLFANGSDLGGPAPVISVRTFVNGSEALLLDPIPAEYLRVRLTSGGGQVWGSGLMSSFHA